MTNPQSVSQQADRFSHQPANRTLRGMVQRLVIPGREEVDRELPVAHPWWQFSARFNVAISQSVPVARMHGRESEGVMMRWGLAQQSAGGTIDFTSCGAVRSDTVSSAQELKSLWMRGQRGIVPLAGFYVWQRAQAGYHQPYYVRLVNRPVFGAAVLWARAEAGEEVVESCALLTVDANPLLADISPATLQMPAILTARDYQAWLAAGAGEVAELLRPYPHTQMVCHRVAPHVNNLEYDEPGLIRPAEA